MNPNSRYTQNLWILYRVNKEFSFDVDKVRISVNRIVFEVNLSEKLEKETNTNLIETIKLKPRQTIFDLYQERERKFRLEISNLRLKYNLSSNYQSYLEALASSDDDCFKNYYSSELVPNSLMPIKIINPNNPNEYLSVINITTETSIEELKAYWPKIISVALKNIRNKNTKKSKAYPRLNIERDLKIFELKESGCTSEEVANIINKEYSGVIGYQDINIIIKRLKEKAKEIIKQDSDAIM